MSSFQNSAFRNDSALKRVPPQVSRSRYESEMAARARAKMRMQTTAPDAIWGHYNNYRSNGIVISSILHIAVIGLLVSGVLFGHQIVEKVPIRQVVTLIAPSPDSYALPTSKQVVAGGGGGGDHDPVPAPKGRMPKVALQQITPPAIVLHNDHPKLTAQPTVVVPPQVRLAENHMPTVGLPTAAPVMPSAPPSNGTGSGGGIGSGSGGGVGVG